jgi:FtsP/CotA-like multicopper oxidase with cupredoxin domain
MPKGEEMSADQSARHGGDAVAKRLRQAVRAAGRGEGGPIISRRRLLATGVGLGATLLVPSLATGAGQRRHPAGAHLHGQHGSPDGMGAAGEGLPLLEPEVRRSINGELRTGLRAGYAYVDVGGHRLHVRTYDGMIPGPTLRARPGDVLHVRLVNDLPPNRDPHPHDHNLPHHFNTTNLHTHGLHVSPAGIADNVLRDMEPGQAYEIEVPIPASHLPGTYWYHPHRHGSANVQLASGMAGALILEGDFDDVPEIAEAREQVLIIQQLAPDRFGTVEHFETVWPMDAARLVTINGQVAPTISMRPGEVQRWRIIQAGFHDYSPLVLDDHVLHEIAADGIALPGVRPRETILLTPGQRTDVLVQAGAPGTYALRSLPYDQELGPIRPWTLARVVVAGEALPMGLPTALPAPPHASIRDDELTGTRQLTFSARQPASGDDFRDFEFVVDGRRFDPERVDQRIRLGAVEEWTITNLHDADHPFHIHTNAFQVVRINGQPLAEPIWRDTVNVTRLGSVTLRSRFEDFTGRFVLHCHILNHEDIGMMQLIEVYVPA